MAKPRTIDWSVDHLFRNSVPIRPQATASALKPPSLERLEGLVWNASSAPRRPRPSFTEGGRAQHHPTLIPAVSKTKAASAQASVVADEELPAVAAEFEAARSMRYTWLRSRCSRGRIGLGEAATALMRRRHLLSPVLPEGQGRPNASRPRSRSCGAGGLSCPVGGAAR